jgi:hypothetical protein
MRAGGRVKGKKGTVMSKYRCTMSEEKSLVFGGLVLWTNN